mgnify:FL=1
MSNFKIFILLFLLHCLSCNREKYPTQDYGPIEVRAQLYQNVYTHLMNEEVCPTCVNYKDGDLTTDFGDATAYAPALFFSLKGEGRATADDMRVAEEMAERQIKLVTDLYQNGIYSFLSAGISDPNSISETFVGIGGIFIAYEATREEKYKDTMEKYLDTMEEIFGPSGSSFLNGLLGTQIPPYGPTTVVGGVAGFYLQYIFSVGAGRSSVHYAGVGYSVLQKLNDAVFDQERMNYRYKNIPGYSFIYQYSNLTTLQGLIRAYLNTQNRAYLDRAKAVMETLELLWSDKYKGYFSAENDPKYFSIYDDIDTSEYQREYIPLSGANYQIYANILMYQVTKDEKYRKNIEKILDFIEGTLYKDGIVWHDIQNGKLADRYCSGCNFQLLYNIYLYDRLLKGKPVLEKHIPFPNR